METCVKKSFNQEISLFLSMVNRLSKQDKINLRKAIGRRYQRSKYNDAWVSLMKLKSFFPSCNLTDENLAILMYVAGLKAKQTLDLVSLDEDQPLAENALKYLYYSSSDSTKKSIESLFRSKTFGDSRSLTRLDSLLKRTSQYKNLNLFSLLKDLLNWSLYDSTKMKWATAILKDVVFEEEDLLTEEAI